MFARVTDLFRETEGSLSLQYIKHRLIMPEMYLCTSVSDFVKNQDQVVGTGLRLFQPGKRYHHRCILDFESCNLRKKEEGVYFFKKEKLK